MSSPCKELTRLQRTHPQGSRGSLRFDSCRTRGPQNSRSLDGVIFSPVNVNPGSANASAAARLGPPPGWLPPALAGRRARGGTRVGRPHPVAPSGMPLCPWDGGHSGVSCPPLAPKGLLCPPALPYTVWGGRAPSAWGQGGAPGASPCPWGWWGWSPAVRQGGGWYPQLQSRGGCGKEQGGGSGERASPAGEGEGIVGYRLRLPGVPPTARPGAPSP